MYDELVRLVSTVGFPCAVSIYLLVRLEKKLDQMTKAFLSLTKSIEDALRHPEGR